MLQEYTLEFSSSLDVILNESNNRWRPLDTAMELVRKLDSARQLVADINHQLSSLKNRMNADLALSIRRHMPALNVGIDRLGSCKVGYKSKHLLFSPDIEKGIWMVSSPDARFTNRFNKLKRHDLVIGSNIEPLIGAITGFFTDHYKSLGEEVTGQGIILVEGKLGSLTDLVKWRDEYTYKKPLNSRMSRKQCLTNA